MSSRTKRALTLIGVLLVAAALSQTPFFAGARHVSWDTLVRMMGTVTGHTLVGETRQNQLDSLQADNIRLRSELADYARLKAQLGTPAFDGFKAIPAAVIARPVDTFGSEFVISRGADDGITLGAPLVINSSTLVGFVSELHQKSAIGRLLVHPSTTVTAEVAGDGEKIQGLVVGDRYTALRFTTVPRDLELKKDEPVVTTAKPNLVPGGLVIGTITTIHNQQNAAYQEAQLKLPYNPDQLSAVAVLVLP